MKKQNWFSRWLVLPVVVLAMISALVLGFTRASFNDIETSTASTATAWASTNWTQTTQAQFTTGVLSSVNTTASPGDVILVLTSTNTTNSPAANTGSAWTNPTNAYADGGGTATITSGNPSGSNVWGNYGFALSGSNITSVRVRYDAWSTGGVAQSQTIVPTADYGINGTYNINPTSPTTKWDKVDDPVGTPDNGVTFIMGLSPAGNDATFNNTFSVPAGSTITNLVVYFRASDNISGPANMATVTLVIGGINRRNATMDNPSAPGTWTTYNRTYTTNPATGGAWTVDQINGVGANALNAFGVGSDDCVPHINYTQIYAVVNYTTANNEQIELDVSWDGGTSWSSVQTTNLTAAETTYWYDVTAVTTWTPAKLANGQLQVRALTQTVGDNGTVSLDWIPVEVTYSQYAASGTFASQVLDTTFAGSRWDGVIWDRTLLPGTNITFEVRASDTAFLKTDATPNWTSVGATSPVILGLPSGRYKQWRATLSTTNTTQTPALNEVRTYYFGG